MRNILLVALLVALCLPAATANAGIRPGSFSISAVADGYTFDGRQHLQTRPVVGVRAGYNLTAMLGIEGVFDYIPTTGTRPGFGDADVYRYGAEALVHVFPGKDLVPYVAAGLGGITIDRDGSSNHSDMFDYGVGLKYFFSEDFAVRGDLRHIILKDGGTLYNYEYTVGLAYQFGGRPSTFTSEVAVASPEPPRLEEPQPPPVAEEPPPVEEEPLPPVPAAEPEPGRFKYCTTLHIEFDIDKALVRPAYHDEVGRIGEFMRHNPTTTAVIEGHTDDIGSADYNLQLSQQRAWSVVDYLAEHFGIDRGRLSARGYGATRPLAENASNPGKQQNRRIEAVVDCAFAPEKVVPPERLCMQLHMEFGPGKADIESAHHEEIAAVAAYLKRYPSTTALIEGHTDNVGGADSNMKLSQRRAQNVVDYLVEKFGIDRARLTAQGYGATRRIAYNATPEGRQKNRRINAVIDCVIKPGD